MHVAGPPVHMAGPSVHVPGPSVPQPRPSMPQPVPPVPQPGPLVQIGGPFVQAGVRAPPIRASAFRAPRFANRPWSAPAPLAVQPGLQIRSSPTPGPVSNEPRMPTMTFIPTPRTRPMQGDQNK